MTRSSPLFVALLLFAGSASPVLAQAENGATSAPPPTGNTPPAARPGYHYVARQISEVVEEEQRVTVQKPVVVTEYQEQVRTVRKPIFVQELREERRTVQKPIVETVYKEEVTTVERPVTETVYQEQVRTVQKPVYETVEQEQTSTVYEQQTVWTSRYSGGLVIQTPTTMSVPRTVVTRVPTQTRYIEETVVEKIPVNVQQFEEEQIVERVPVQVQKLITEEVVRKVPVMKQKTVYEERPIDAAAPQASAPATNGHSVYSSAPTADQRHALPATFADPNQPAPTTAQKPLVIENARVVINGSEVSITSEQKK
jgi:hypothetical protein